MLTKVKKFGILSKLSAAARAAAVSAKKNLKNSKKVLDSQIEMCYLNQVAANNKRIARRKSLKKVLDKRDEVWYSKKAPPMRRVPCKLNNVTNEKHQTEQLFGAEPRVA